MNSRNKIRLKFETSFGQMGKTDFRYQLSHVKRSRTARYFPLVFHVKIKIKTKN